MPAPYSVTVEADSPEALVAALAEAYVEAVSHLDD